MEKIEFCRLWEKQYPNGAVVLSGKFGFSARLRIEALPEPDERGATHVAYILPPAEPKPQPPTPRTHAFQRLEQAPRAFGRAEILEGEVVE